MFQVNGNFDIFFTVLQLMCWSVMLASNGEDDKVTASIQMFQFKMIKVSTEISQTIIYTSTVHAYVWTVIMFYLVLFTSKHS